MVSDGVADVDGSSFPRVRRLMPVGKPPEARLARPPRRPGRRLLMLLSFLVLAVLRFITALFGERLTPWCPAGRHPDGSGTEESLSRI